MANIPKQLRLLADQPVVLLCVLLAANALARPYANIIDDARLYSAQVLNRASNGAYQNDLFFRYGSQDQYSIFSILAAPLVNLVGLETAFFLLYLAATAGFIAALIRLVPCFVEDRLVGFLALLYLVMAPLNYGGLYCVQVHEPFLTPRLLAIGLVLWGLDFLLQRRYFVSLVFMVLAGSVHPLIAVGGLFTWTGVFLVDKLGWRNCLWLAMGLSAAGIALLMEPLSAWSKLAPMDDAWRDTIHSVTPYVFLSEWELRDWINVLVMGIGLGFGIHSCFVLRAGQFDRGTGFLARPDGLGSPFHDGNRAQKARFLVILALLGAAALVGTALSNHLPFALLIQGQPYRCLWILKVLQIPLCFALIDRLWHSGTIWKRAFAAALAAFFASTGSPLVELSMPLYFLPLLLLFHGRLERPRRPDWIRRSLVTSLVLGEMAWTLGWIRLCLVLREGLLTFKDTFEYVLLLMNTLVLFPWIVIIIGLLLGLGRIGLRAGSLAAACLAIALAVQLVFFVVPNTPYVREHGTCYLPDIEFARAFLNEKNKEGEGRPITVYCAYGKVEYVWVELRANCYFDMGQTSGFIFNRQTAMEGKRRALLVEPFVMAHYREFEPCLSGRTKVSFQRFFKHGLDAPAPTYDDLVRLCWDQDEQGNFLLDYAVLKHEFPGCAASNGRAFIYDCRQVRMNSIYQVRDR